MTDYSDGHWDTSFVGPVQPDSTVGQALGGLGIPLNDPANYVAWQPANAPAWARAFSNPISATLFGGSNAFSEGLARIVSGRVGQGTNYTYHQAWDATDRTFGGVLPGGVPLALPKLPDLLPNLTPWLIAGGLGVGALLLIEVRK